MGARESLQLLRRVLLRTRLIRFGRAAFVALLIAAGAYAVLLVLALVSVIPAWPVAWLAAVPAAALIAALIWHRRPSLDEAAHLVDERMKTKDLFLTVAMIQNAPGSGGNPGDYAPLVVQDAEAQAPRIRPETIVPFHPWPKAGGATLALGALAALLFITPVDPFGLHAKQREEEEKIKTLREQREQTKKDLEPLEKRSLDRELSRPVESALSDVKMTLEKLKPNDPLENQRKLNAVNQKLGDLWQKNKDEQLQKALKESSSLLRVGAGDLKKTKQWKDDLKEGKTDSLEKEFNEMKDLADQLMNEKDESKRQQIAQELDQRLKAVADFAQNQVGSDKLREALNNAAQQLDAASSDSQQVSQEALQGMKESLQLSEKQMQQIAQMLKDEKALQQAMQAVQQAQQLNQLQQGVDGEACKGACEKMGQGQQGAQGAAGQQGSQPGQEGQGEGQQGAAAGEGRQAGSGPGSMGEMSQAEAMARYCQLYSQMISQCRGGGEGDPNNPSNSGMGGPGRGKGNIAPENPDLQTDYKTERPNTQLDPTGKMLLDMKEQGISDKGEMHKEYRDALTKAKQKASDAVTVEEVPPGYHEGIKGYFERLENRNDE